MNVTLLGFTVPDDDLQRILPSDAYLPTQTHSFAWALVRALDSAGVNVTLLSVDPIANYPGNARLVSLGGTFKAHGVHGRKLTFVNLLVLKHLTRFFSCLVTGGRALRSWRPDVLLVHGVHSPFLLYARICQRTLGIPIVAILTDPPGFVRPSDGKLARYLKRLDVGLVRSALAGFDGVIALTESLAAEFAPAVPHMVMEGIVDALPPVGPRRSSSPSRVTYAGVLNATSGVDRMVDAVRELHPTDIRLSCFGRGELSDWVAAISREDPRIELPQLSSRDDVIREYEQSDVLVQPRPVHQDFARFSFPSKLLEYLASGTPVVSTRLPGIPADYEEHVYWAEEDSARGLSLALERALGTPWHERQQRAAVARDFVWKTRGYEAQGRRMKGFLSGLIGTPDDA